MKIVSAYRKKARKCHPDKNPDNPKAAELFHELSKALELLTDAAARAAYDKALKAKKAAELRHRELDSKRKKLKEDLEAREDSAEQQNKTEAAAKKNLEAEIERLRKEGNKLLETEQELLRESLKQQTVVTVDSSDDDDVPVSPKIKVKWKARKGDESNGGYDKNNLEALFSQYGDVAFVLVSAKKSGSAIIEFDKSPSSKLLEVEYEDGLPHNPFTVSWLSGKPQKSKPHVNRTSINPAADEQPYSSYIHASEFAKPASTSDNDFESLVLRKMRQAEERKRLIEQMQREDEEG
ncbi:dnaJ homolog subfamily C member 17 isoform X2 [Patella vulgata]|uniref:dnaJ homolog subfamily C member 17 isoform X2 n=1 Tax=Patella vulgata TaxID=6465 RepID=UPI0024A8429E|nr:dnaJ homolog subfamily C member 17 isoform X2 [Patella vulgata]